MAWTRRYWAQIWCERCGTGTLGTLAYYCVERKVGVDRAELAARSEVIVHADPNDVIPQLLLDDFGRCGCVRRRKIEIDRRGDVRAAGGIGIEIFELRRPVAAERGFDTGAGRKARARLAEACGRCRAVDQIGD